MINEIITSLKEVFAGPALASSDVFGFIDANKSLPNIWMV